MESGAGILIGDFRGQHVLVRPLGRARLEETDHWDGNWVDSGLYAHDAYVLETTRAERLPLLTLDEAVGRAAKRLGLRVLEVDR
jgi:hypothetical protein